MNLGRGSRAQAASGLSLLQAQDLLDVVLDVDVELGGCSREGLHGQGPGGLGAAPHGTVQGQRVLLLALQRGDRAVTDQTPPWGDAPHCPCPQHGASSTALL